MPFFNLTPEEIDELNKPNSGTGGYQSFFTKLQSGVMDDSGRTYISQSDLDKLHRYALKYGQGGWQGRLSKIFLDRKESLE